VERRVALVCPAGDRRHRGVVDRAHAVDRRTDLEDGSLFERANALGPGRRGAVAEAQLGALQVWRNAMRDQAGTVAAYRRALGLGSTRPLPELYAAAGIKLAFDSGTIGELVELIETELQKLEA